MRTSAIMLLLVAAGLGGCGEECKNRDMAVEERAFVACVATTAGWNAYRSAEACRKAAREVACRKP